MQYTNAQVVVFAKAPQPGQVKTRLIPALGQTGAAALYVELLSQQMNWLSKAKIAPITCCCTPLLSHPLFQRFRSEYEINLELQCEGDLGARMYHAAEFGLRTCDSVILIGGDCPAMSHDYIVLALELLQFGCDAVVGPAEDGGYVLLGLRKCEASLFSHIDWGSDTVLATTIERLKDLGWEYRLLPELWDIDRPEDIERYQRMQAIRDVTAVLPPHVPIGL